jgi:hypothetical protein
MLSLRALDQGAGDQGEQLLSKEAGQNLLIRKHRLPEESTGDLIFSFRMNMKISEGVEVNIHSVGAVDDQWNLTSRSKEPFDFEVKSYLRDFPAPPNNKMAVHVSFCLVDGDLTTTLQNRAAPAMHCPHYLVIDSRGSGDPVGKFSAPEQKFVDKFKEKNIGERMGMLDNPYPAAGDKWAMIGGYFRISIIGKYHASVVEGKKWLTDQVNHWSSICPVTKLVLTGYSQGAQAAGDVAYALNGSIWAVVLYGDPYFNSEDGWRNDWSFSDFYHGRLGERYALSGSYMKVVSFCHAKDPVCQNMSISESRRYIVRVKGHWQMPWHENYQDLGEPEAAAEYLSK